MVVRCAARPWKENQTSKWLWMESIPSYGPATVNDAPALRPKTSGAYIW